MTAPAAIAYVGLAGAGLGFRLSGIDVFETAAPESALATLRKIVADGHHDIIFVDEGLAADQLAVIAKLNAAPRPAIILLPNPAQPQHVAAGNLQQLMIRAIGTDIFS